MRAPSRDLVAPVANMLMAAVAGGAWGGGERGGDHDAASGAPGPDLSAPVDADAGAGAPRIDRAPICDGGGGDPPRVGAVLRHHHRCRFGSFGARGIGAAGLRRGGPARLSRRGGRGLWPRDLPAFWAL